MSADANDYDVQNVECQSLIPSYKKFLSDFDRRGNINQKQLEP